MISNKIILLVVISVISVNAKEPFSIKESINKTDDLKSPNDEIKEDDILNTTDTYEIYENEYINATFNRKVEHLMCSGDNIIFKYVFREIGK